MSEPLRFTDPEVGDMARALVEHGEDSPEYKDALGKCVQRLSDWIDAEAARQVYGELFGTAAGPHVDTAK